MKERIDFIDRLMKGIDNNLDKQLSQRILTFVQKNNEARISVRGMGRNMGGVQAECGMIRRSPHPRLDKLGRSL